MVARPLKRLPKPKVCEWCGEPDHSVGKDDNEPESCFTCIYVRCNLKYLAKTSRGRKFLREVLKSAAVSNGQR